MNRPYTNSYNTALAVAAEVVGVALTAVLWAYPLRMRQATVALTVAIGSVALLPGNGFGAAGASNFRISFAGTADAVRDGLARVAAGIGAITAAGRQPAPSLPNGSRSRP